MAVSRTIRQTRYVIPRCFTVCLFYFRFFSLLTFHRTSSKDDINLDISYSNSLYSFVSQASERLFLNKLWNLCVRLKEVVLADYQERFSK